MPQSACSAAGCDRGVRVRGWCGAHYQRWQRYGDPLGGESVAERSRRAERAFRDRLTELGATLVEPGWLGSVKPHRVICVNGHMCNPRPNWVQQGHGICRVCVGTDPVEAERKFRKRLDDLSATLLEPGWLGANKPHRVICARAHECQPTPSNAAVWGICVECGGYGPAAAEAKFRARLAKQGAVLLEPQYLGGRTRHRVRCAAGHVCRPLPSSVVQGIGACRTCSGHDPEAAEAAFRARLIELGAVLLDQEWLGSDTPHRVICPRGHACRPRPCSLKQGQGVCRTCSLGNATVFYVVTDDQHHHVKFGVTSRDPRPRLRVHRATGFHTVRRLIENMADALLLETLVIRTLRDGGMVPVKGREYFDVSALALIFDVVDNYPIQAVGRVS